ncbi:mitofilin family membrane protein [Neorhizobium sp. DT-125]|uniref:COG4223 family protein n=1 Tax=Neorhizobium sp. DT-125 TaxID=3396163 RepID=UPI003F1E37E7
MVSEKPPRRSKVEKEPVTIDLAAEEADAVAEPVRSNDTDEPFTPAEQAAEASENVEEPVKAEPAEEPAQEVSATDEPVSASFTPEEPPFDTETTAEAPIAPENTPQPEPATVAPEPEPVPAPRQRTSPAATTLAAAGIFGGIVALLLAGSMQYAGYLPGATPAPAPVSDTSALSAEIAALRQEIETLRNQPAPPDAALADRVAALEASAKAPDTSSEQALAALKDDVALLRSAVESTAGNNNQLEDRIIAAEAKLNDRGPEQQVARAVAAAALKAAIDRGGPFETELQTFASVAGDDPAIAELQKFGAVGVPSSIELQREFPRVADAMLEAVTIQPDPDQGIAGRLLSSAMSVVKVRRVGDVEGDTPEAVVARMEENLRKGDLQTAAREWDALPEPAKAVSRDFRQKLDARIQVENLVGGTLTRAVAGTKG